MQNDHVLIRLEGRKIFKIDLELFHTSLKSVPDNFLLLSNLVELLTFRMQTRDMM